MSPAQPPCQTDDVAVLSGLKWKDPEIWPLTPPPLQAPAGESLSGAAETRGASIGQLEAVLGVLGRLLGRLLGRFEPASVVERYLDGSGSRLGGKTEMGGGFVVCFVTKTGWNWEGMRLEIGYLHKSHSSDDIGWARLDSGRSMCFRMTLGSCLGGCIVCR